MRRNKLKASFVLPILLATTFPGCRCPDWWAYRSLRCIPETGDASSHEYWQQCKDLQGATEPAPVVATPVSFPKEIAPASPEQGHQKQPAEGTIATAPTIRLASHVAVPAAKVQQPTQDPLRLPPELPGAETPPLSIPRVNADGSKVDAEDQKANILKLFPELTPLPIELEATPDASIVGYGLEELHRLARENHPGLRAAAASVESARGLMIQAGLPPNPNAGYQGDTIRTANTPGYHGAYLQQTFITAQKLGLAAQAAAVDYANAHVAQRKTWVTVQASIRREYFQVLATRKRVVLAKALSELSEQAYKAQIKLVIAGEAAPYEPLQLRVLTTQARRSLIQAQQDAIAAWRRLAAAVAVPSLQASPIEGRIDCNVPEISYESAVSQMISVHTDLRTAENLISKHRTLVTLADRKPIPDLNVGLVVQKDHTFEPGTETYNLVVGGAIPVFDKNQGNRISARAELVRATQQVTDTENQLIAKLASSYGVYKANRQIADSFRTDALSDQVRAYRGIYQRYLTDPTGISFNDVIVAQQTVAGVLNQYIDILQSQWQSTVDLGELLQVDDLFLMGDAVPVAEIPEL